MKGFIRLPYEVIGELANALSHVAPDADNKVVRTIRARRGLLERFAAWGESARDQARPLLWIHAPSVGEGLQALPVMELFRQRRPDVQLAYTFYSPSAEKFARGVSADFVDYLPFDTATAADRVVAALRPDALVFSKLDVWPLLSERAAAAGVRLGMISATMEAGSGRGSAFARPILHDAYQLLDAVGAVDADDAARLVDMGVRPRSIAVTGDTRYDQVWARVQTAGGNPLVESLRSTRPTLLAGSTWPADEQHLLPAWLKLRSSLPAARLVIAPHEPTGAALSAIEKWAGTAGLSVGRAGQDGAATRDVVLIDRTGVLGDLYSLARVAYVGGGFHAPGLHSVIEPASFGAPVLFGSPFGTTRDARLLVQAGAARACAGAAGIADALRQWMGASQAPPEGRVARQVVEQGVGAAERSFKMAEGLLKR